MRLEESQLADKVYAAIKKDSLQDFGQLASKDNRCFLLCFGRFPMLSLCYILGAKKIASEYQQRFLESLVFENDFIVCEEPIEAYKILKENAGTALRLYASSFVYPAEALAITAQTDLLKRQFLTLQPNQQSCQNIIKIYESRGRKVSIIDGQIRVGGEPIDNTKKRLFAVMALITALFAIVFSFVLTYAHNFVGTGKENSPLRIYTQSQLLAAFDKDIDCRLQSDIVLSDDFLIDDFTARLDGNNKKIIASNSLFAKTVSGSIKNLEYIFEAEEYEAQADFTFFATINKGTIEGVSISVSTTITEFTESDLIGSALVLDNYGLIRDCSAFLSISIVGDGYGEFSFGGLVGTNYKRIENSMTQDKSTIASNTVDIAGIAYHNFVGATIQSCTNNADLSQITLSRTWNPIACGIAVTNSGSILDCTNNGEIKSESLNDNPLPFVIEGRQVMSAIYSTGIAYENSTDAIINSSKNTGEISAFSLFNSTYSAGIVSFNLGSIKASINQGLILGEIDGTENPNVEMYIAGIACLNSYIYYSGNIEKCKNYGNIFASIPINIVYCGGIAAYSDAEIINNAAMGEFNFAATENTVVICGGIIAECGGGDIVENYSTSKLIDSSGAELCLGGIIGLAYGDNLEEGFMLIMYSIDKNYYAPDGKIASGIGNIFDRKNQAFVGGTSYKCEGLPMEEVISLIDTI